MLGLINNLKLHNNYFSLRHGKSDANLEGIILSDPKDGVEKYGLIMDGENEIKSSVKKSLEKKILDKNTIIISSDFKRAKESAEIAKQILNTKSVILSKKLRERYFGDWEKTKTSNYKRVWSEDLKDPDNKKNNVESPNQVLARTMSLINDLETKYKNENILLVSHGDTLQILQTAFKELPASKHSDLNYLKTGGIRKIILK